MRLAVVVVVAVVVAVLVAVWAEAVAAAAADERSGAPLDRREPPLLE